MTGCSCCHVQEELSTLKEGEVRERTPARAPERSFGPRRLGQVICLLLDCTAPLNFPSGHVHTPCCKHLGTCML